jgi:restriction endonuclease S subunit
MTEIISNIIDSNKVFFLNRSDIEGRIDPNFYSNHFRENKIKLNSAKNKVVLFREIINEFSGGPMGFHLHTYDYRDTGIPVLRIGNLKEMYLNKDDSFIFVSQEKHEELKNSQIKAGDLIFSKAGKVGELSIVPEGFGEGNLNQALSRISLKNNVNVEYVYIFFKSAIGSLQIQRFGGGRAVQDDLKMSEIEHFKIVLPSIENQNIIIDFYNKAYFKKLQKESEAKVLLESISSYILKELGIKLPVKTIGLESRIFTSLFSEAVGIRFDPLYFKNKGTIESKIFPNNTLRQIASINKGQSITKEKITEGNYPVIAGGQSSPYTHSEFNFKGNVITVSASGAYSGFVWYHDYPIFASDCIVLQSKNEKEISTHFIYHVLKALQGEIYKLQQGAGQPHVYARDLEKVIIPTPSPAKQNEMLKHINDIHKQINKLQSDSTEILESAKQEVERMILG